MNSDNRLDSKPFREMKCAEDELAKACENLRLVIGTMNCDEHKLRCYMESLEKNLSKFEEVHMAYEETLSYAELDSAIDIAFENLDCTQNLLNKAKRILAKFNAENIDAKSNSAMLTFEQEIYGPGIQSLVITRTCTYGAMNSNECFDHELPLNMLNRNVHDIMNVDVETDVSLFHAYEFLDAEWNDAEMVCSETIDPLDLIVDLNVLTAEYADVVDILPSVLNAVCISAFDIDSGSLMNDAAVCYIDDYYPFVNLNEPCRCVSSESNVGIPEYDEMDSHVMMSIDFEDHFESHLVEPLSLNLNGRKSLIYFCIFTTLICIIDLNLIELEVGFDPVLLDSYYMNWNYFPPKPPW